MRIATMVKGYLPVPTPADIVYAPIELALQITDGLASRGHEVDFYAPTGSSTGTAAHKDCGLPPLAHNYDEFQALLVDAGHASDNVLATWDQYLAAEMFRRAADGEYDVLLFHHPEVALPFVRLFPDVPVAYIMHDPISELQQTMLAMHASPNQHVISISDKQREPAPDLPYLATIYNGIDTGYFKLSEAQRGDSLLFLGSVLPRKGTREAIEVARLSGRKLVVVGPTYPGEQDYFDQYVQPAIDEGIVEYHGHVPHDETAPLFQQAAAFLMPIQWEEPFGLTMAEAMACGTPVIALRRGSVPEILEHGVTGFIADSPAEMAGYVEELSRIDGTECRRVAEERFSLDAMIDGYETALSRLL